MHPTVKALFQQNSSWHAEAVWDAVNAAGAQHTALGVSVLRVQIEVTSEANLACRHPALKEMDESVLTDRGSSVGLSNRVINCQTMCTEAATGLSPH